MDLFIVILNIICAIILISYVLYKSHKKSMAAKKKDTDDDNIDNIIYSDDAE